MPERIVISGATGFVGTHLIPRLMQKGYDVVVLSRSPTQSRKILPLVASHLALGTTCTDELREVVNGAYAIINLAGANIGDLRWTKRNKELIVQSRVQTTQILTEATRSVALTPRVFMSASAVGYYGDTADRIVDEQSPPGTDFLASVCSQWEAAARDAHPNCRVVTPRLGVVMDPKDGALAELLKAFRMFVGGPLGSGRQWFPWIHRDDLIAALMFLLEHTALEGPVNCAAPTPVRMSELATEIGRALHRPSFIRVPEWLLKLILGEKHIIVTAGQRIDSHTLVNAEFIFMYPQLSDCVNNLLFKH